MKNLLNNCLKYGLIFIVLIVLLLHYKPSIIEKFDSVNTLFGLFGKNTINIINANKITPYGIWCNNQNCFSLPSGLNSLTLGCYCPESTMPRKLWPDVAMDTDSIKTIKANNKAPLELYIGLGGAGNTPGDENKIMSDLTKMYNGLDDDNKFDGIDFDLEGGIAGWDIVKCIRFTENFEKNVNAKKTIKIQITILVGPSYQSLYIPQIINT